MSVVEKGTLVSVEARPEGSSLSADVALSATLLPVKRDADFTGTLLDVGGATYAYTVTDGGLLLTTGLVAAASEGDPVLSLNDLGEPEFRWVAVVQMSAEDPEPIEAELETAERGYFRLGDADAGALVTVESVGEGYRVLGRPVDPASLDQTVIDVPFITLYQASNTLWPNETGPSASPTPVTGWTIELQEPDSFIYNNATGEVEALKPGLYDFNAAVNWAGASTGRRIIELVESTTGTDQPLRTIPGGPPDASPYVQQINLKHPVAAGDKFRLRLQQTSGAGLNVRGDAAGTLTVWQITRVQA